MKRNPATYIVGWCCLLTLALFQTVQATELPDFRQLVKDNAPAVVNISTTQTIKTRRFLGPGMPEFPEGSPFGEFFKHFFEQMPNMPKEYQAHSLGSGFVISSDGYVLTNAHVVKDADKIIVRLSDHSERPAQVVGTDERTDVALLKIDGTDLPTVKIGNSDNLDVGEWVVAIGSPFGLEHTATAGIVSAVGRSLPSDTYVPFIQTDVAVNPGNSGGPLFNISGEVVGINAQIVSNTGGYMGLSFAIPINIAMRVADQLRAHGHATHGWLGVMIQAVTQDLAQSFGLDQPRGALVAKVVPDSPAAKAGIQVGDIILSYNGKSIEQWSELPLLVGETPVGTRVSVKVLRHGETKTLHVGIEQLSEKAEAESETGGGSEHENTVLNLTVADLSAQQREEMGVGDRGVLVQDLRPGPAAEAGLMPGDVILMLNHEDVHGVSQFAELVRELPKGKSVPLLVQRDDNTLFLAVKIPGGK